MMNHVEFSGKPRRLAALGVALTAGFLLGGGLVAQASNPAPSQIYYVPFPEDQIYSALQTIGTPMFVFPPIHTVVSIAVLSDGTRIYYDQWEDAGYDADIANPTNLYSAGNPAGTQIWGDGDASNGCPPNVSPCTDAGDVLSSGDVVTMDNWVPLPRDAAQIFFDGRDKFASSYPVAMTRAAWAQSPGTLLACAVEILYTSKWDSLYRTPVGENTADDYEMFEYSAVSVMASQPGTDVNVDGIFGPVTATLNEGEQILVEVNEGAEVTASHPVQVHEITGDVGSNFASRSFTLTPVAEWCDSLFTPVGSTPGGPFPFSAQADVFLFNPNSAVMPVQVEFVGGVTGSVDVPPESSLRVTMPDSSGGRFTSNTGSSFFAVSTVGSATAFDTGYAFDWGFSLVPENLLTSQFLVGWGPGSDDLDNDGHPDENTSPVWVAAAGDTTVYVDYDGTGGKCVDKNTATNVDRSITVTRLESVKVEDPNDNDATGMRVFTCDGTNIVGAWGEDPADANPAEPGLDLGTKVPPLPVYRCAIDGPFEAECVGDGTQIQLDGSRSAEPSLPPLSFDWTADCPGATFDDPHSPTPILTIPGANCDLYCNIFLKVSDGGDFTDTCATTAHLSDTTQPRLSVPPSVGYECDETIPPARVTAEDDCSGPLDPVFTETRTDGPCAGDYTLTRTWTATDDCGNAITKSQLVIVQDTHAPVLDGVPPDVTVECDAVPPPANPTAKDNCSAAPVITFVETRKDGPCAGTYTLTRTWTAADDCGNKVTATQVVTVADTAAPVLSGVPPDVTVECDAVPPPASPTSKDNCDPAPAITFVETRTNGPCADNYTLMRTWTATDECGNTVTAKQVVTVQDTHAPALSGVPVDVTVECDAVPPPPPVTALDNCGPAPAVTFEETQTPGSCADNYTLTRTWTATDRCGNAVSKSQTITVRDTTLPALSGVPADATVECDAVPPPPPVTALDNCDPAPTVTFTETKTPGSCLDNYTLTRTWAAADRCGNAVSKSQTITVRDTTAPSLSGAPPDMTLECGAEPPPATVTAMDTCDPAPRVDFSEVRVPGDCPGNYTLERTWIATDRCDNVSAAVTQVITVRDTQGPVITVPPSFGLDGCAFLWPPMHGYVVFSADATGVQAVDACSQVRFGFSGCSSSQPEDNVGDQNAKDGGDGHSLCDCAVSPDFQEVAIRAERDGGCHPLDRVYGVGMSAVDECGNRTEVAPFGICVYHDKGHQPPPYPIYRANPGSNQSDDFCRDLGWTNGTYPAPSAQGGPRVCGPGCSRTCDPTQGLP